MTNPLKIAGVGHGHHDCEWQIRCPIAVSSSEGNEPHTLLHELVAPVVRGAGAELPGLLGLRSLENHRAILDTGGHKLLFPGPGDVKVILPPGSLVIPLHKAPSGHLCMAIDDSEHVANKTGGLPAASLTLHATATPQLHEPTTTCVVSEPPAAATPPPKRPRSAEEAEVEAAVRAPESGAAVHAPRKARAEPPDRQTPQKRNASRPVITPRCREEARRR